MTTEQQIAALEAEMIAESLKPVVEDALLYALQAQRDELLEDAP